jgi:dienelactone hydrolase
MRPPIHPTLLLATDIFGHTPEVQTLARQLGGTARIVSPYGDDRPRFASEIEAYAAFTMRTSIAKYAALLCAKLRERPVDLAVGFSAGASALWLCLAEAPSRLPRRAELYYGSRIRDHVLLRPCCPTRLTFAAREASFDPLELARRLCALGHNAEVVPGSSHGFMNPLSTGYYEVLATKETQRLKELLNTWEQRGQAKH